MFCVCNCFSHFCVKTIMVVNIPVPIADIFNKLSILSLKLDNASKKPSQDKIKKEINKLLNSISKHKIDQNPNYQDFLNQMLYVNASIWETEDKIYQKTAEKQFDQEFVDLCRRLYLLKTKSFSIRQEINKSYRSMFVEEKFYST